jgi:hypothetical protein
MGSTSDIVTQRRAFFGTVCERLQASSTDQALLVSEAFRTERTFSDRENNYPEQSSAFGSTGNLM